MKKMQKLFALTAMMTMLAGQAQGQDSCCQDYCADSEAYYDCGRASYMSALLPIGALVVAGIIIATTNRHHHSSSSCSSSTCTSSSSHSHCDCHSSSSSSCGCFSCY